MIKNKQKVGFWRNYGLLFEALNFTFWKSIIFPILFFILYPLILSLYSYSNSLSRSFPNIGHWINSSMCLSLFVFPKLINELKKASIFEKFFTNSKIIYKTYFVLLSYIFLLLFIVYIYDITLLVILNNLFKLGLYASKWDYLGILIAGIQFALLYTTISLALIAFTRNNPKIATVISVLFIIFSSSLINISDSRFNDFHLDYIWLKVIYYILPFRYPASNLTLSISENPDATIFTYKTIIQNDIFSLIRLQSEQLERWQEIDHALDLIGKHIKDISNNTVSEHMNVSNNIVSENINNLKPVKFDKVVVEWWEQILNLLVPFVLSGALIGSFITRQISYKK